MQINESLSLQLADLFRTLSDASRLRIISALLENELNVGDLAEALGMSASAVSHQLHGLRQMRLVRMRKQGREVFYILDDSHVSALFQQGLEHLEHNQP
jgi:ArsR family transcriptional regulator, lead/cadmium/zinc/bismuth-responsive transcriptional repressor